jgi:hypothetical protein
MTVPVIHVCGHFSPRTLDASNVDCFLVADSHTLARSQVKRGGKKMWTGEVSSLRRIKDVVKEVERGLECGVVTAGFSEWKADDKISAFMMVEKVQTLDGLAEGGGKKPKAPVADDE